jgi:aryl-alcohol dehydrogenase-like predicted oxidoreductase
MRYRRFGRTDWDVSEIGYGMWGMGDWSGSDDEESLASLERSVELGCTFFDTAWVYGRGRSESLLGRLVRAHPQKRLYTATKVPPKNSKWPSAPEYALDDCYPPDHVEEYVHRSLQNSGLTRFDLVQLHTWNPAWLDDDRWLRKLEDLRRQGLVGAIGISLNRWGPETGVEIVKRGGIDAIQVVYNIFDQAPEDELFPVCREHGVAVIARVPFDEGSLTGALKRDSHWPEGDWRNSYFTPEKLATTVDRVDALKKDMPPGLTLAELALRFILSHQAVSTVIPGMRKPRHVEANLAVSDVGPLEDEQLRRLHAHRWQR